MSTDGLLTLSGPTMGTRWTARFAHAPSLDVAKIEAALADAMAMVDHQMSNWRGDSDLIRLNNAPTGEWLSLPAPLMQVLQTALRIGRASDGVFDIGVGGLVRAWGFGPANGVADPAMMRAMIGVPLSTAEALELDPEHGRARKHAPLELDLSGIAKGYGADLLAQTLCGFGLTDFLVGLDGELVAAGLRPDGHTWAVALEQPIEGTRSARGVIELSNRAVATSGDYRHVLKLGDGRVSHTMNPRVGGPAQNALASVSVLASSCVEADAWATVLMVLGEEAGPIFARSQGIEAIFLIRDGHSLRDVYTLAAANAELTT
ncbi:MAG: FAD:protein FMN transferase [Paracoccaceae bacterium]